MKKNLFIKIICIFFILFFMFCSARLAFGADTVSDTVSYSISWTLDDTKKSQIYNRVERRDTSIVCPTGYIPFLHIYCITESSNRYSYFITCCIYKDGNVYRNIGSATTKTYYNDSLLSTENDYGGVGGYVCRFSNLDDILITNLPFIYDTSQFKEGKSINVDNVQNGGLDFITGNNYDKNNFTNYSSDIFYPVPMGITYYNDNTDVNNYDKFRMSFDVKPDSSRYSNISNYDLELWVSDVDRRIFVKSFPLASLQYQAHSGGSSWGDSGNNIYYVLEDKLHNLISFVDELGNPLTLEFRLVYRINDTSYLESGYVDVNLDLTTGKVNSVNYYPDGMDETGTGNDNPIIVPDVVYPSNPGQYIFNINWDNSNLDEYVKNNFGVKNYIIALKDNLSFIPDFFWTMQFYLLGVISAIGIYRLVIK